DAQDAHEAIRPTSMEYDPERVRRYLTADQYSLYRLIWNRFVASQMNPAIFDETIVEITAGGYLFPPKKKVARYNRGMAAYGITPGEPDVREAGGPGSNGDGARGQSERESASGEDSARGQSERESASGEDDDATPGVLPPLAEGDRLELRALKPEQKFTQ